MRILPFFLFATPVLWLIIIAPTAILISWWFAISTLPLLGWSLIAAPLLTLWVLLSFQTANLIAKWPAVQLLGLGMILLNVIIFSLPLLLLIDQKSLAALVLIVWIILVACAVWKAQKIENSSITVSSRKLGKSIRILHLSDVHAGSRSRAFIQRVVKQSIRHNPDVVFITGDLIDSSQVDSSYLKPLSSFTCPVYLCLGNHERYVNLDSAIAAIEANNIHILRNQTIIFDDLQITGIDDQDTAKQIANELPKIARNPDKYQILLYHRPAGFSDAAREGIDLMLSGHTHAGQIWPFGFLVKRQFPQLKGLYRRQDSLLYISQGTGTWGPVMRLGTSSEMTLIHALPQDMFENKEPLM